MKHRKLFVVFLTKVISYSILCDALISEFRNSSIECNEGYIHFTNFFRGRQILFWDRNPKHYLTHEDDRLKTCLLRLLYERASVRLVDGTEIERVISGSGHFMKNSSFSTIQGTVIIEHFKPNLNNFKESPWLKLLSRYSKSSVAFVLMYGRKSQVECSESDLKADGMYIILEKFFYELWTLIHISKVIAVLPYFCNDISFVTYDHKAWIASDGKYGRGICFHTHKEIENNPETLIVKQLTHGFSLRISMFDRMPTSPHLSTTYVPYLQKIIDKTNGFGGLDGFVMAEAVKHFNFTPIIIVNNGYEQYGYFTKNGTAIGSLGDVVNGVVDISFNSRFMKVYGAAGYDFLKWIHIDSLCIVVDKAGEIPQWTGLLPMCSWDVAWMLLGVLIAVSVLRWMYRRKIRKTRRLLCVLMFDTQVTSIFQGFVRRIIPEERFIIALCLFLNLIVSSIYQGNIKASYSTKKYYPDVNTLEELDQGDYIIGTSPGLQDIFGYRRGDTYKSLSKKLFIYSNSTPVRDVLRGYKAGTIERESDANILMMGDESGPGGEPLLHVVPECPRIFFLGYIVGKNFPFTQQMNDFVTRMVEAGLPTWYYMFTKHVLLINSRARTFSYARDAEPLDIKIVRAAYYILFAGIGISTIVLLIEIAWVFRRGKK